MAKADATVRPGPTDPAPGRTVSRPPSRRDRLSTWLLLLLVLVLAAPPLLIDLYHPDVTDAREARTLLLAIKGIEQRQQEDAQWLDVATPRLNCRTRWDIPPAVGWLHLLVLPAPKPQELWLFITSARMVSVVMGLLTIACVYWAGFSIGGIRTAGYAAAICATGPVFLEHARIAIPSIHMAAWATMSIAAALWALRPLRPSPSLWRQAMGWALCGLAMGLAVLTIGPGGMLAAAAPVLFLTLLCPDRASHLLGLLAALLLAALVVLPWATYAHVHNPDAWSMDPVRWIALSWITADQLARLWSYMALGLGVALLPWTLWLIGAIVQPFSTSSAGVRTKLFLGWGWFIVAVVLMLLSAPELRRAFTLMVIPAAAVLIAEVFTQYVDMAASGRLARLWRVLRYIHLLGLMVLSVALPLLIVHPKWLVERGMVSADPLANFGWWYAGPLMGVLVLITTYTALPRMESRPGRSLVFWTLWSVTTLTAMALPWSRAEIRQTGVQLDAEQLAMTVGDTPIYWLTAQREDPADTRPGLLLYGPRRIRSLAPGDIPAAQNEQETFFLLVPHTGGEPPAESGVRRAEQQPVQGAVLYKWHAPPKPAHP